MKSKRDRAVAGYADPKPTRPPLEDETVKPLHYAVELRGVTTKEEKNARVVWDERCAERWYSPIEWAKKDLTHWYCRLAVVVEGEVLPASTASTASSADTSKVQCEGPTARHFAQWARKKTNQSRGRKESKHLRVENWRAIRPVHKTEPWGNNWRTQDTMNDLASSGSWQYYFDVEERKRVPKRRKNPAGKSKQAAAYQPGTPYGIGMYVWGVKEVDDVSVISKERPEGIPCSVAQRMADGSIRELQVVKMCATAAEHLYKMRVLFAERHGMDGMSQEDWKAYVVSARKRSV